MTPIFPDFTQWSDLFTAFDETDNQTIIAGKVSITPFVFVYDSANEQSRNYRLMPTDAVRDYLTEIITLDKYDSVAFEAHNQGNGTYAIFATQVLVANKEWLATPPADHIITAPMTNKEN